jgi:hypothetical protein
MWRDLVVTRSLLILTRHSWNYSGRTKRAASPRDRSAVFIKMIGPCLVLIAAPKADSCRIHFSSSQIKVTSTGAN